MFEVKRKCLAPDCLHEWRPRQDEPPERCPRCQRPYNGDTVKAQGSDAN